MPELPEVELARRDLQKWWVGRRFKDVEDVDAEVFRQGSAEDLEGAQVSAVERRGKFLLVWLDGGQRAMVIHLRMTGKVVSLSGPRARLRAIFTMDNAARYAFVDTRRLGHLDVVEADKVASLGVLGHLGPEPWPVALTGAALRQRLGNTRRVIKTTLMDQKIIAGVGNIVAAESLWRARVDPRLASNQLQENALERLAKAICEVCQETIEAEEGKEIAYLGDPESKDPHNPFAVYRQQDCPRCQGPVGRLTQGGRTTYWCPDCQSASVN